MVFLQLQTAEHVGICSQKEVYTLKTLKDPKEHLFM